MQQFQSMALVVSKAFVGDSTENTGEARTAQEAVAQFKAVFGG